MPWNPKHGFYSQLDDAAGTQAEACVRTQKFTYWSEKDPKDTAPYVFVMMTESGYAKDEPSEDDFIIKSKSFTNGAGTKLSCTFEMPADYAEDVVMLGFGPDYEHAPKSQAGYGGDKFPVKA